MNIGRSTSLSDYLSNTLSSVTNQTNLALKGIIGIGAMAKIADAMNQTEDAQLFSVCPRTVSSFAKL